MYKILTLLQIHLCSKKDRTFQIARQPALMARYGHWARLAAGFDNKLPFASFRYEH